MKLGETTIPAGVIRSIPGEKEWTVILNKATNVWGHTIIMQVMT